MHLFQRFSVYTNDFILCLKDSNLTSNYNYFYDRIQRNELLIDELYEAITRLELIEIKLNNEDNPQLIFESLNSTGLALSEGDKIRNFILMGLKTKQQNEFYEKYWNKIEICTDYDVSLFIRDYLGVKQQSVISFSKIYQTFKDYVTDNLIETEDLLKNLYMYAQNYEMLIKNSAPDKTLRACIERLNRLETTITRPFFLEVLRYYTEEKLSLAEVTEIFLTTENYIFRRTICELPTNMLNKLFVTLHREITRYDITDENYVEKFKFALLNKKERAAFPDNREFIEAFSTRQVYLMNSKNKVYILERFENRGTKEDKDIYRHIDEGEYSIEHIMPQTLSEQWRESLGEYYEDIHESWLHRIANLTLTAYNSRFSNRSFEDKKTMDKGFIDSGIRLNQYIASFEEWNEDSLKSRDKTLMTHAINIWPLPTTQYKPAERQLEYYSLDDDINLSGAPLYSFGYKNTEYPSRSWRSMYEQMIRILHSTDPSILYRLAHNGFDSSGLSSYFSSSKKSLRDPLDFEDDIFLEKNLSTMTKISILRRLFKLYDADPTELVFYLKDDGKNKLPSSDKDKMKRRFWSLALEHLQSTHDNSYRYVTPTTDNWLTGAIGTSGFYLSSNISNDEARAELVLAKPEKEINKLIFDYLLTMKEEIEASLDKQLHWARNDTKKSSKIYFLLDDIEYKDESQWPKIAEFYAKYTKVLSDVLAPLVIEKYRNISSS